MLYYSAETGPTLQFVNFTTVSWADTDAKS